MYDRLMRRTVLICAVLVAFMLGCGGSDDGGTTMLGNCGLDIVVSGGYEWKSAAMDPLLTCGATGANGTSFDVEAIGPGDGVLRVVKVLLGAPYTTRGPLIEGEIGTFDVVVNIAVQDATVEHAQWRSVLDGCSFKVVKNDNDAMPDKPDRYVVGGTVTCAEPLPSFDSLTNVDPIMVNAFKFQSFDDYLP